MIKPSPMTAAGPPRICTVFRDAYCYGFYFVQKDVFVKKKFTPGLTQKSQVFNLLLLRRPGRGVGCRALFPSIGRRIGNKRAHQ